MSAMTMTSVLRQLRQSADGSNSVPDAELLTRYLNERDSDALTALICRHAAMVWGVCRRVLGPCDEAEDAFQATFLVLLRRASSIWPREKVGNWLHGVAFQTARKARSMMAKRMARERSMVNLSETASRAYPSPSHDIDEALAKLPEKYRTVVILCELQGCTRAEAARKLACAEGTIASRLSRGRTLLANRLRVQDFLVPSLAVAASMPSSIFAKNIDAVRSVLASDVGPTAFSPMAISLANSVARSMTMRSIPRLATILGLMVGTWFTFSGFFLFGTQNSQAIQERPQEPPANKATAVPEPAWKQEFRTRYGLKPSEFVKRVAPPYSDCRAEYLRYRFGTPQELKDSQNYFTMLFWKHDWAPPELARHTTPVPPEKGLPIPQLLAHLTHFPPNRIENAEVVGEARATGDFVVRQGATPEQLLPPLCDILNRECGLKIRLRLRDTKEDAFVLNGHYEAKPVAGRDKTQIEIYAKHLGDRTTGGGGTGSFADLLSALEGHIRRPVVLGKTADLPKRLEWHYNVRSPMVRDPVNGTDTFTEDTNPFDVMNNLSKQTGLRWDIETRPVRKLVVEPDESAK